MKRTIFTVAALLAAACGFAQMEIPSSPAPASAQPAAQAVSPVAVGVNEWLTTFSAVEINAPLDVRFVQVPSTQAPRIIYDTKGSSATKFKFNVKDKTLHISERPEPRRTERTTVTVEYNDLTSVRLDNCTATFDHPLTGTLFDLTVGGTASVTAAFDVQDLALEATGRSTVNLTGRARYLSLYSSTGRVEASGLEAMAVQANVTASSRVSLWITERLDARTATGGTLTYKGTPAILRCGSKFMGGGIVATGSEKK